MDASKSIVFFGTNSTLGATTLQENDNWNNHGAKGSFARANVAIVLTTLTLKNTSGTLRFSIRERFSGAGFIETASGTTSAHRQGQTIWFLNEPIASNPNNSMSVVYGPFPNLGNGLDKQVFFDSAETAVSAVGADVYWVFYH